jgi:hypothetical protein
MKRLWFDIKYDKVDIPQMNMDFVRKYKSNKWGFYRLIGSSSLLWVLLLISTKHWMKIWDGGLVLFIGISTVVYTLLVLYHILSPFIVRFLVPVLINLLDLLVIPINLIQYLLSEISDHIYYGEELYKNEENETPSNL